MAKFLLILVLVITIPRWAQTLAQVDTFTIFSIPMTAIGEGIVLELACWFLIQAHGNAYEEAQRYKAAWTAHSDRMKEQGKTNHKPKTDPELSGYWQLMVLYYVLLGLTVLSQWPFLMSTLSGIPVTELLGYGMQWAYTLLLVFAPEIVTFALARSAHFGRICKRRRQERGKNVQSVGEKRGLWTFLDEQVGHLAQLRASWRSIYATSHSDELELPSVEQSVLPEAPIQTPMAELTPAERQARALELWQADPRLTQAQVAEQLGAARATIGNDYRALALAGIVRRNGHGVEVRTQDVE